MADETIDKVQIEVQASARGTDAVFKQLESHLGILKKAFDAIDTSKLAKIQKAVNAASPKLNTSGMSKSEREIDASIKKIQESMAGLKTYAEKAMGGDKSAFSTYDKQATSLQSTMDKLAEKLKNFGNAAVPTKAFEKLDSEIESTRSHLEDLKAQEKEALEKGGTSDYEMVQLGFAIQETEDKLKSLGAEQDKLINEGKAFYDPYEPYRESLDQLQAKLSDTTTQIQTAMTDIANAQPTGTPLDAVVEKLQNELPAAISKIQQDFAGLGSYAEAALGGDKSAFTSFERRVTSIQSAIDVVANKLQQLEGAGVSTEGLESYRAALQAIQEQLGATSNAVQAAYAQMNNVPAPEVSKEADKASSSMHRLASSRTGLEGISKSLSKIKDHLKGISIHGPNMGKLFKTILKYGFGIRSLYVLFRRLRKAVVESFGELQNSGAFFETTRANVESLKESLTTLKYQFGAAFEPIFNAVAPAIKVFIDKLVEAMNAISAFMARLTGKSTYSKAVYNAAKFANNTGKAAKAQKELNKQLQGFDELNNLTTNNNNGGGSGSGSNSELPDAYYVEERVDNALGDWGKHLADLIKSGDWKAVGKTISTKLAESLESIKWDDIKRKAGNFGKNLADFLNGLIDPRLFGDIGKTIGEAINTGLTFFNEWGKGMDWENLGKSLASGFNEWLKAGNLPLLGETLHTWIAGGLDALITFLDEADFEELGKQLAEFIANLDIPDLVAKLAKLAVKILKALGEAIKSLWDNSDIKDKLVLAIVGILLALNFVGKLGGLATLILTGLASGFGTQGIAGAFGSMVGSSLAGQTVTATASGFSIKLAGVSLIMSGTMAIGAMALGEQKETNIFDPNSTTRGRDIALTGGQYALGLGSLSLGAGALKYIFSGGASKILPSALGFGKSAALPLLADVVGAELGNQIGKDFFSTVLNDKEMASYYKEYEGFGNIFDIDTYRGLGEIFGAVKDGTLGKAWNELWGDVGEFFYDFHQENRQALKEWLGFSDGVEGAETSMKDAWDSASQRLFQTTNSYKGLSVEANVLSNTTKTLTSRTKAFGDETKNSSNKFKQGISGLSAMAQNVFGEAYTKGTQKWSGIGSWASQKSNEVKNGVSNLPSNMSNTFSNAYSQSTSKWSGLGAWASSTLNKVPSETRAKLNQVPSLWSQSFTSATNQGKTPISQFQSWLQRVNLDKKASVKADETSFSNVKKNYNDLVNKLQNKTVTINVQANGFSAIGSQIQSLSNQLSSLKYASTYQNLGTTNYGVRKFATGGIVSGATRAIVGEAGPEAIIPLTDGTLGSLSKLIVGEMVKPQVAQISSPTYSAWGSGDSSVSEQNALLREEVQLLRQIAGKELTISSSEVFKATQAESNNYYNRTGNSPFLF